MATPSPAPNSPASSFQVPLNPTRYNFYVLPEVTYVPPGSFVSFSGTFTRNQFPLFAVPHWWLNFRTRLVLSIVDSASNRFVDYVNLDEIEPPIDLTYTLMSDAFCSSGYYASGSDGNMWCTNHYVANNLNSPTYGIMNQIAASSGQPGVTVNWNHATSVFPVGLDKSGAIDFFRVQFNMSPLTYPGGTFSKTNIFYSPFNPTRNVYFLTSWQANDPLVHYTLGDLNGSLTNRIFLDTDSGQSTVADIGVRLNRRYEPWALNLPDYPLGGLTQDPKLFDMRLKDPGVNCSDAWSFPTNKFPNIGWLGVFTAAPPGRRSI